MTDGLLVLVAVGGVAVSLYVFRRWGWPAVLVVWTGAAGILAAFWRRAPVVVDDVDDVRDVVEAEQAADAVEEGLEQATTNGDLLAHVVDRSTGRL